MKKQKNLRVLVCAAILAALSIVLGKFAAINIGDTIRVSFENLPLILASLLLGPIPGAACGICADLLGCLLRGYQINPIITLAAAMMGAIPGLLTRYVFRSERSAVIFFSAGISHIIASMGVKTVALHLMYSTPYAVLFMQRIPNYLVIGALEAYLCVLLLKSRAIRKAVA